VVLGLDFVIRRVVVRLAAVLLLGAVSVVQWTVTTPGVVTDTEFHALLLASVPCMTAVLAARWVDEGARPYDPRG
jgi:hypothetical protein